MSLYKIAADGSKLQEMLKGRGLSGDSPHSNVSASLSPNGSRIVYAAYGKPNGIFNWMKGNKWEVYTTGLDEHSRQQLTSSRGANVNPVWSPSGDHITFLSNRYGIENSLDYSNGYNAYLVSVSGSPLEKLPGHKLSPLQPQWSLDGRYFAYGAVPDGQEGTENWTLHIVDIVGSSVVLAEVYGSANWGSHQENHIGRLAWAPDSRSLLFTQLNDKENAIELYAVDPQGTNLRLLKAFDVRGEGTDWNPARVFPSAQNGYITHLSWSPDGKYIAFAASRVFDDISTGAYIMRPDGTDIRQILPLDDHDWTPHLSWSPDSSEVVINGSYLVRPDGTLVRTLHDGGTTAWSPDGTQIAVYWPLELGQQLGDAENALWVINRDGTDRRILAWRDARRDLHLCNPQTGRGTPNLTPASTSKPLRICDGA